MKEIIEHAIIIYPAFWSEMTLVTDEKSGVFIVLFKISYLKMVSLHECAEFCVIRFASRARDAGVIVEFSAYRHAQNEWTRVNLCQRAQEQFQIDPYR